MKSKLVADNARERTFVLFLAGRCVIAPPLLVVKHQRWVEYSAT